MEKFEPFISVVVPTYNRKKQLYKTLGSILNQSYSKFEVIVVDNCSDYNFFAFIETLNDDRIKAFQNANNGIIAVNRNFGIRKAKGEFVAFCDDDDWWYENKLEVCLPFLKYNDVVYHYLDIDSVPKVKKQLKGRQLSFENTFEDLYINGNSVPNSSVIVRKEVIKNVGYISEDKKLMSVEDYECWLKISMISSKFISIPLSLGAYYVGSGNVSNNALFKIRTHKYLFNIYNNTLKSRFKKQAVYKQNLMIANWYYEANELIKSIRYYLKNLHFLSIKSNVIMIKRIIELFRENNVG